MARANITNWEQLNSVRQKINNLWARYDTIEKNVNTATTDIADIKENKLDKYTEPTHERAIPLTTSKNSLE